MQICIYEDSSSANLFPLVYLRPVFDLRCGIFSLYEKVKRNFPKADVTVVCRPLLQRLVEEDHPGVPVNRLNDGATWFINGHTVIDAELKKIMANRQPAEAVYLNDGIIVASYLSPKSVHQLSSNFTQIADETYFHTLPQRSIGTQVIRYPWDLIRFNQRELESDAKSLIASTAWKSVPGRKDVHAVNRRRIHLGHGVQLKPGVVLDAENGDIIIGKNVQVMANAVILGPAYIGEGSIVKVGAKIYPGTSVGKICKVGGEIEGSILHSYSNKQHDGFLGHSYLGSWINLGADTNTSDLKNTYGPVTVNIGGKPMQTGMQFLGTIMGDHSKTGINVMLNTGSVIGISCNIFGAELPPKFLPSFSWGRGNSFETYDIGKSLETARRVMERRSVTLSASYESVFREVFRLTGGLRNAETSG